VSAKKHPPDANPLGKSCRAAVSSKAIDLKTYTNFDGATFATPRAKLAQAVL
jgi:hypothetical protein